MKIINSNVFQVIYYYYYLFQRWINGVVAEHLAIGMLIYFLSFMMWGILLLISAFIYNIWIAFILCAAFSIYIYTKLINMDRTGLTQKIIKKKPKIMNSHILSIIFVILFTVLSFLTLVVGGYWASEINDSGMQLIK
jgi:hypothetical protein